MEILNNIWTSLSTENETLMTFLSVPLIMVEAYISLLLFTTFLKIAYTKKQKYFYILAVGIVGIISMNLIPPPANTIINYFLLFFIIKNDFKISTLKTILSMIIPFFTFTILGSLILNTVIKSFGINFDLVTTVPIYRIIYLSSLYSLTFIMLFIFKFKHTNDYSLDILSQHNKNIVSLNLILGIVTLIIQLIITRYYINSFPLYVTLLSCLSLAFYFIISFYSLNHIIKLQRTTTELENAESYNKTLSFLYDNVKGFKHDFDDIVNMIGGYVKNNDLKGLKEYYIELENDYEKVKNIATLNPSLINNPGIYNLLVTKYKKAKDCGVKINLEYFFDFNKLHMPVYQFSRILGILLDNAIEAASISEEKQVEIRFRDSSRNNTQIIIIQNTYSNKNVDTKKIFEKGVSEKKEHMGMGLWEVNQIVMKNNNINLITTNGSTFFKQQLEIYY